MPLLLKIKKIRNEITKNVVTFTISKFKQEIKVNYKHFCVVESSLSKKIESCIFMSIYINLAGSKALERHKGYYNLNRLYLS